MIGSAWAGAALAAGVSLWADQTMAAAMTVSPALRQAAATACTGDVLSLCPSVIFDEQQIFACMQANRARLTPTCRSVFDAGAKTVRR